MFHLYKQTRLYEGYPYCGYSSGNKPLEFDSLEEAEKARIKVNEVNPVGWDIWDSETGEIVSKKN